MTVKSFEGPINSSEDFKQIDQGADSPVLNSESFAEKYPMGTDNLQVMPMSGTATAIAPLNEPIIYETPMVDAVIPAVPGGVNVGSPAPLFNREESEQLRTRWNEVQGKFVDEPRAAVQQADALVSEVVQKIIKMFASEHNSLEGQWNQGMDVSTEDLRKALQHYRSFFNRLVV